MAASIRGPTVRLGKLAQNVTAMREIPEHSAQRAAARLRESIEEQFDSGTDPYGEPWAGLKLSTIKKGRSNPPLTDTGTMRDSLEVSVQGTTISAVIDSPAQYHQTGTRVMDARKILPDVGIPDEWRRILLGVLDSENTDPET